MLSFESLPQPDAFGESAFELAPHPPLELVFSFAPQSPELCFGELFGELDAPQPPPLEADFSGELCWATHPPFSAGPSEAPQVLFVSVFAEDIPQPPPSLGLSLLEELPQPLELSFVELFGEFDAPQPPPLETDFFAGSSEVPQVLLAWGVAEDVPQPPPPFDAGLSLLEEFPQPLELGFSSGELLPQPLLFFSGSVGDEPHPPPVLSFGGDEPQSLLEDGLSSGELLPQVLPPPLLFGEELPHLVPPPELFCGDDDPHFDGARFGDWFRSGDFDPQFLLSIFRGGRSKLGQLSWSSRSRFRLLNPPRPPPRLKPLRPLPLPRCDWSIHSGPEYSRLRDEVVDIES